MCPTYSAKKRAANAWHWSAIATRSPKCWFGGSFIVWDSDIDCMTGTFLAHLILYSNLVERRSLFMGVFGTGTLTQTVNSLECQNLDWTSGSPNWRVTSSGIYDISPNWRQLDGKYLIVWECELGHREQLENKVRAFLAEGDLNEGRRIVCGCRWPWHGNRARPASKLWKSWSGIAGAATPSTRTGGEAFYR